MPIWINLDNQFWPTLIGAATAFILIVIAWSQNKINRAIHNVQDAVEIYAFTPDNKQIHLQNVGTRLIYLDKYIFNGVIRETHQQILPPAEHSPAAIYWIDLPSIIKVPNPAGDDMVQMMVADHVSLEVLYRDVDGRNWKTTVFADYVASKNLWQVNARARDSMDSKDFITRIRNYIKRKL